jgi:DNA primase large subunit
MSVPEIAALYGSTVEEEAVRYQAERLRGESPPTEYAPPSCATMQAQGDCVNMDERCETVAHPLAYYESALAGTED